MKKKEYVVINSYKYHGLNVLFIILNLFVVWKSYNFGFFGNPIMNFGFLMKEYVYQTVLNPIDLLFVLFSVLALIIFKKEKNKFENKEVIIEITIFRRIFLTIILFLTAILFLLFQIKDEGGSILIAFISFFYLPLIFNLMIVQKFGTKIEMNQ